jgi:hypothetical protein
MVNRMFGVLGGLGLLASACTSLQTFTILPPAEAESFRKQCSREFPAGLTETWTPTSRDVRTAEQEFPEMIRKVFAAIPDRCKDGRPETYYRQYAGFLREGRRVLYLNGLRRDAADELAKFEPDSAGQWRSHVVGGCDGGIDYLGVVFDFEAKRFDSLAFNGPSCW